MIRLVADKITKCYDGKTIIDNVSVTLNKGEIVCLLGVSGTGKTTLFNVLAGLTSPENGNVYLDGEDITGKPGKISYMLQKDLLLPYRKVVDNIALPLLLNGMNKKEARARALSYFHKFGLEGTQMKYPHQLSGGMRQRAALLRTYLSSGGVALLDEPFSALDTITKSAMHRWYLDIMQSIDMSTLFITHDIDEAVILSDRIYIMTGLPGQITTEIVIKEKKPRDKNFNLTSEFIEYKKEIINALEIV